VRLWVVALGGLLLWTACGHYSPPSRTPEAAKAREAQAAEAQAGKARAAEECDPEREALTGQTHPPGAHP
jgi:hypothetical protein